MVVYVGEFERGTGVIYRYVIKFMEVYFVNAYVVIFYCFSICCCICSSCCCLSVVYTVLSVFEYLRGTNFCGY